MQSYSASGKSPWSTINTPALSMVYSHKLDSDWRLSVAPTVETSGEQGTSASNSLTFGGILNASKQLSPTLNLGLGTGVFRQIDTNRIFPYLVIDWKISDRWNLNNPFPGGPAGGAGLELTYAATPSFKVSGGAAYRSYRFRLNDSGAYPGGVGQNQFVIKSDPVPTGQVTLSKNNREYTCYYENTSGRGHIVITSKPINSQ
jgi:hypothetical protein